MPIPNPNRRAIIAIRQSSPWTVIAVIAGLTVAPIGAWAQKAPDPVPNTINMTLLLKDAHGKPIPDVTEATADDKTCEKCDRLTVGAAIANALDATYADERGLTFQQKLQRGFLAKRLRDDAHATLSAPEVALIERLLGEAYPPIVLVQIQPMIDPGMKEPPVQ